jgi:hypothetical protein
MASIKITTDTYVSPYLDDNGVGFALYQGEQDDDGTHAFISYEELVDDFVEIVSQTNSDGERWLSYDAEDEVMAMVYDLQRATDYLAERFEELRGRRIKMERENAVGATFQVSVYGDMSEKWAVMEDSNIRPTSPSHVLKNKVMGVGVEYDYDE